MSNSLANTHGRVREWIGPRIIPVFADEVQWSDETNYEPLVMVQNQGETFMSRQYVPAGIELPSTATGQESNDYWVHMSNWNAQVEGYRDEVLRYAQEVLTFDGRITANTEAIGEGFSSSNTIADTIGEGFSSASTIADAIDTINADSWVTAIRIAIDAVTTAKIQDSAVTTEKIADNAITNDKIADNAITNDKVADNAVTTAKIADNAVTHEKISDKSVTTSKINANSFISAYKEQDGPTNVVNIAASNDGVNWTVLKKLTVENFDACNIIYSKIKQCYILSTSGYIRFLDSDFNVIKSYGEIPAEVGFAETWAQFICELDDKLYYLSSLGTTVASQKNAVGASSTSNFAPYIAEIEFDENSMTIGELTQLALSGYTTTDHIDVNIVKANNMYYLAIKDELECKLEIYTASSLLGTYTKRWENVNLRGIEAPKPVFIEDENKIRLYFSAYYPQVYDCRNDNATITSKAGVTYKVVNKAMSYISKFAGFYEIDALTFADIGFMRICRFEDYVPRHMGVCIGCDYKFNLKTSNPMSTYTDKIGCVCSPNGFVSYMNQGFSDTSDNYCICIPAIGDKTVAFLGGTYGSTFTGALAIVMIPVNCETMAITGAIQMGNTDNRSNKDYRFGGYEKITDSQPVVNNTAKITSSTWVTRTFFDNLGCSYRKDGWY